MQSMASHIMAYACPGTTESPATDRYQTALNSIIGLKPGWCMLCPLLVL